MAALNVLNEGRVYVKRGGYVECLHHVHSVVLDRNGDPAEVRGNAELLTCMRSSAKPLQAVPLVEWGIHLKYSLEEHELAALSGSVNGEAFQVEVVRSILAKAGLDDSALRCGPAMPSHRKSADALRAQGIKPAPIYHNCAAKHAGMLITCKARGWDLDTYLDPAHPLQKEILGTIARYAELPECEIKTVVDGCGLPVFFMPLRSIAVAYRNLALKLGDSSSHTAELLRAALKHPEMIAGTDRLCTDVMTAAGGRLFVKVGADGVYAAFNPEIKSSFAMKVEDGNARALNLYFIKTLERLRWLTADEMGRLEKYWNIPVRNSRGDIVGVVETGEL